MLCASFGLLLFQQVSLADNDDLEKNNDHSQSQNENRSDDEAATAFLKELADLDKESTPIAWHTYADLSSSFEYQNFDLRSAEITTISFQPHIYNGSWLLGLGIPWKSADGNAIIYPNGQDITDLCSLLRIRIDELAEAGNLIRARSLNSRVSGICVSNQNRESGLADVSLSVSYEHKLGRSGRNRLGFSSNLKWDNGDIESRIGSGTRELWNQVSINRSAGGYSTHISLGHTTFVGGEFETLYQNYFDVAARLKKKISQHIALGISLDWLEASDKFSDNELSISANTQFYFDRHWYFLLQGTHYIEAGSSIKQSYNGSITYSF